MFGHDWFMTGCAISIWFFAAVAFVALLFPPDAADAPGPGQARTAWRMRRILRALVGTYSRRSNVPSVKWWYLAQGLNYTGLGLFIVRSHDGPGSTAVMIASLAMISACAVINGIGSWIEWRRARSKIAEIHQRMHAEGLR